VSEGNKKTKEKIMYYHTSPKEITEIYKSELFGYGLFFAASPYYMGCSDKSYIYAIDDSKLRILELSTMQCRIALQEEPACQAFAEKWGLSLDDAADLIAEDKAAYEFFSGYDAGDASWEAQGAALEIAVANGYDAVSGVDEQGQYLLVDARRVQMTLVEEEEEEEEEEED
jgi:hypothetical protein